MTNLELIMTHFFKDGGTVFVNEPTKEIYIMQSPQDTLHIYDPLKDKGKTQARRYYEEAPVYYDKKARYTSLAEAEDVARAIHNYDRVIQHVMAMNDLREIDRQSAIIAIQEIRTQMVTQGQRILLEIIFKDRPDLLQYLDMSPEEVLEHLKVLAIESN